MLKVSAEIDLLNGFTVVYGLFLFFLAFLMFRRQSKAKTRSFSPIWTLGPKVKLKAQDKTIPVIQTTASSSGIGLISGLTGLGGGFFFMPIFNLVLKIPLKQSVGTSLAIVCLTSSLGASSYILSNLVNLQVALYVGLGSMVGGYMGASLTRKIEVELLKKQFAGLVLCAAGAVLLKFFDQFLIAMVLIGSMSFLIVSSAILQFFKASKAS